MLDELRIWKNRDPDTRLGVYSLGCVSLEHDFESSVSSKPFRVIFLNNSKALFIFPETQILISLEIMFNHDHTHILEFTFSIYKEIQGTGKVAVCVNYIYHNVNDPYKFIDLFHILMAFSDPWWVCKTRWLQPGMGSQRTPLIIPSPVLCVNHTYIFRHFPQIFQCPVFL